MLDELDIEGKVITADALLTQTKIADYIVDDRGADFVFTVKENQPTLRSDIEALDLVKRRCDFVTVDKGHGRLETREIWVSSKLNDYVKFPHVSQVFTIRRHFEYLKNSKKNFTEVVHGITSQSVEKATPEKILKQNREHWSIENKTHHVLDVSFNEDRSTIRHLNGPLVITLLRRFAIGLHNILNLKNHKKVFRKFWAKPHLPISLVVP